MSQNPPLPSPIIRVQRDGRSYALFSPHMVPSTEAPHLPPDLAPGGRGLSAWTPRQFQKADTQTFVLWKTIWSCGQKLIEAIITFQGHLMLSKARAVTGGGQCLCQAFEEDPVRPPHAQRCLAAACASARRLVRLPGASRGPQSSVGRPGGPICLQVGTSPGAWCGVILLPGQEPSWRDASGVFPWNCFCLSILMRQKENGN